MKELFPYDNRATAPYDSTKYPHSFYPIINNHPELWRFDFEQIKYSMGNLFGVYFTEEREDPYEKIIDHYFYETYHSFYYDAMVGYIVDYFNRLEVLPGRISDFGCGIGVFSSLLLRRLQESNSRYINFVGYDISQKALDYLAKNLNLIKRDNDTVGVLDYELVTANFSDLDLELLNFGDVTIDMNFSPFIIDKGKREQFRKLLPERTNKVIINGTCRGTTRLTPIQGSFYKYGFERLITFTSDKLFIPADLAEYFGYDPNIPSPPVISVFVKKDLLEVEGIKDRDLVKIL